MRSMNQELTTQDATVWLRVIDGDQAAFEAVVVKYQNLVASIAYSATGNFAVCEEITQETFWQAWRQKVQLRDPSKLANWLCGIAKNLALSSLRREKGNSSEFLVSDENIVGTEEDPAIHSVSNEERELVWHALESIPENYREVLVLYYREDYSLSEIAIALDASVDAIKQRLSRGRDMIRLHLANIVEDVLVRTRPGNRTTKKIMAGIAALVTSMNAASTATAATLGASAASGTVNLASSTAGKLLVVAGGTTSTGILGGLLGSFGGLFGGFLGSWIPAQLAPSLEESRILQRAGRWTFGLSLLLTAIVISLVVARVDIAVLFVVLLSTMLFFMVSVAVISVRAQKQIRLLQQVDPSLLQPNDSFLRRKFGWGRPMHQVSDDRTPTGQQFNYLFRGKRFTSTTRLLGVPLLDVQFGDINPSAKLQTEPQHAFGWIALGDRATGLILACGSVAKGLFAFGGVAIGGVAIGGVSVGLFAFGGAALALLLGIGGIGIGAVGGGGLGIGLHAVGGGAIGWNSAVGGGAVAVHVARGGAAFARDFAVGNPARAQQANTPEALEAANQLISKWVMEYLVAHPSAFWIVLIIVTVFISLVPALLKSKVYQRIELSSPSEAT